MAGLLVCADRISRSRSTLQHLFLLGIAILLAPFTAAQTGAPWPEADQLFHTNPLWLGADGAFSVDLGNRRVLWLFSDSFVAHHPGEDRKHAAFLHNTVAIQSGYDPSRATIKFYWRHEKQGPSEIFPTRNKEWMWPLSGIRIKDRLLIFCTRVATDSTKGSLGFKIVGWNAFWVTNPDSEPSLWKLKDAAQVTDKMMMASAVLQRGKFLYLFGESEPEHDLYVARFSTATLAAGNFGPLQWWTGSSWQTSASNRHPIQLAVATETSVERDPDGNGFIAIYSKGFGATNIVMQKAQNLTGPWSPPQTIYRPPESNAPDAFVYAGKSHPELKGADLVLTYAANGPIEKVLKDMSLYFPRFVKVDLHPQSASQK